MSNIGPEGLEQGIDQEGVMTAEDMMVIRANDEDEKHRRNNKGKKGHIALKALFHVAAALPVTAAAMGLSYVATGDPYISGAITTGLVYPFASAVANSAGRKFGYVEGYMENMFRGRNYLQSFRKQYFSGWSHGGTTVGFIMAPSTFQQQIDMLHQSTSKILPALGLG
ncbi:MAG: hypothetical protein MRY79_03940 [Alphaproteobacteria bacterium]|nr:hypothetical protein [Alphaproteobacteria bacterium]